MPPPFVNLPFPYNNPDYYPYFEKSKIPPYTCANPHSCKITKQTVLCVYEQPISRNQSEIKPPKSGVEYDYNQTKIKANSPNQSHKLNYAAFARRNSRTHVISHG